MLRTHLLSRYSSVLRNVWRHNKPRSHRGDYIQQSRKGRPSLGTGMVVVDLPVLTTGTHRHMVVCPSASLDAEGSQAPATAPEGRDSPFGPMLLPRFVP